MTDTTEALVESAAKGDHESVGELLNRYLPRLRAFVRLRCGPELRARESSSDIAQSVCRELLQGLSGLRWEGEGAFRSWLFTAALRKLSDRAAFHGAAKRDMRREVPVGENSRQDQALFECYRAFSSPSQHAIAREQAERIESALAALPDEQREVIVLAKIVGLSRADIARKLGRTEGSVRVILHRALARVTGLLAADAGDPEAGPTAGPP